MIRPLSLGPLWGVTYMHGVAAALMAHGPFDIIHGNQVYLHTIPMLQVARATGAAVCSTIAAAGARNDLAILARHRGGADLLRRALAPDHTLIALTRASARDIAAWCAAQQLPTPPVEVLPNFVPAESFSTARREWPPTAIFLGRLAPEKQVPLLLDAFARADVADARLLIVGEGPERARIAERIRQLQLMDRVELLGAAEDPRPHLARAGIAVSASISEGMSNALLEQFASGIGAIMPALPGMEEVFHSNAPDIAFPEGITHVVDAGVLYPPNDTEALARALRAELGSAERRERAGRAAAAIAREHYHEDAIVPKLIALYRKMLALRKDGA